MKLNENEAIATSKVLLVPYCECHVETYHQWMEDEKLRQLTASERLTLSEEHAMQQSWRQDHDKLTFIICLPIEASINTLSREHDSPDRMIGDVNVFLYETEEDHDNEAKENAAASSPALIGEIELMIARKDLHRNGYGRAALLAFMQYILQNSDGIAAEFSAGTEHADEKQKGTRSLAYLRAKISATNESSIRLFRSVGFEQNGDGPNYFGEVELRWTQTLDDLTRLQYPEKYRRLAYS